MNSIWRSLVAGALVLSASGCNDLAAEGSLQPDLRPLPILPQPASKARPSLFETEALEQGMHALRKAIGAGDEELSIEVLEMRATASKLTVQAEDPKVHGRVLQWEYAAGKVQGPVPVELKGSGKLSENLFTLDGVYLKAIPRLTSLAVEHVDPQDGEVSHIVIRRNFPFSHDVRFRVFVDSPRQNGQLEANRFGHPLLG